MARSVLLNVLSLGVEGAVYVAAVMLGSSVALYAAHFFVTYVLVNRRG